jgi:hypothetical protein
LQKENIVIPVPKDAIIENGHAIYVSEFKGKQYLNIRTTYTDKDSDELAIGKGLSIDVEKADNVITAARSLLVSAK